MKINALHLYTFHVIVAFLGGLLGFTLLVFDRPALSSIGWSLMISFGTFAWHRAHDLETRAGYNI